MKIPNSIKTLSELLAKLPGIGPRQAIRTAYFLAGRGRSLILPLAKSLAELTKLKTCPKCFCSFEGENNICSICSDRTRNKKIIAIVEKETDASSIEQPGIFDGTYFILGEIKKSGSLGSEEQLRMNALKTRLSEEYPEGIDEIILGLNHTTYGDIGKSLISKELSSYTKKITTLGRGIPTGGEVEFADPETLAEAIKRRN